MKIRNVLSMLMLAVAMLFVVGCGDSADTPSKVVEKFFEAILDGDVEEASEYCTGATDTEIKAYTSLMVLGFGKNEDLREKTEVVLKVIDDVCEESIDGDRAEVRVEGSHKPFILKKVDGEWKIDISDFGKYKPTF